MTVMFYDTLSKNTVKITLTEQDMRTYSIKSDCITKRSAETKRSLTKFLKKFQSESSVFAGCSAERLFLEAFPSKDGGCVRYVSTLGTEGGAYPASQETSRSVMCGTPDIGKAADMCTRIKDLADISGLYYREGSFFLLARIPEAALSKTKHIMEEYGRISADDTDIAFIKEFGRLVCGSDAAEKLSLIR